MLPKGAITGNFVRKDHENGNQIYIEVRMQFVKLWNQ